MTNQGQQLTFGTYNAKQFEDVYLNLTVADIEDAQAHLDDLPESQRRGLTLETLRHFHCGYLKNWVLTKCRAEYACGTYINDDGTPKNLPPASPRLIVPTPSMNHFNAILTASARRSTDKAFWKQHAGEKELFYDPAALDADTIVVVEGEVDAMTIWQVTGGKVPVVAILGCSNQRKTLGARLTKDLRGKRFVIMLDADAAGKESAEKLRDMLIRERVPAVIRYLYDYLPSELKKDPRAVKIDANEILTLHGESRLKDVLKCAMATVNADLDRVAAQIQADIDTAGTADVDFVPDFKACYRRKKSSPSNNPARATKKISSAEYAAADNNVGDSRRIIAELLNYIPAKNLTRDDWFAVGCVLKRYGFKFADFDKWSDDGDSRYDAADCATQWDSMKTADELDDGEGYDVGTLKLLARQFGLKNLFHAEQHNRADGARLALLYKNKLRYLQDVDSWLTYDGGILTDGGVWTRSTDSRNSYLMPFVTRAAEFMHDLARDSDEHKIAARFDNTKTSTPAITYLKGVDLIIVTERDLDTHHELLNVGNGVIDLTNGKLMAAEPKLLFTRQAPAIYRGIYYRDPENIVEKFLHDILPDEATLDAVIRYLGYALFGGVWEHVAQFWRGDGRNGKTTLLNLLLAVLGSYVVQLSSAAILLTGKPQDPNQATTALNPLDGARLALIDELPQNARLDVTLLKTLTGGGTIVIRQLHHEAKNIIARAKLIINCGQYLPRLDNVDDLGLKERLRNVLFNQTFTGSRADVRLMEKLTTRDALSAALSIFVGGAVRWYRDGLTESADMKRAKQDYLESNDFLREFFDENCVFAADKFIPRKKLLPRIREQYPAQVMRLFGNSDRALTEAIAKIDGISYGAGGKNKTYSFYGVGWQEDDFGGTPISSADYRPE